jgi:hypothetical protein
MVWFYLVVAMGKQAKLFWIVTLATIGWIILMRPFSPTNIVQFELAKTVEVARQIIDQWGAKGVSNARISIYLDFVFIFLYAWAIDLGCHVSTAFSANEKLKVAGKFFSRAIWFAGSCDLLENFAMLFTLSNINELTASMAFYFASIKFAIVLIALLLIFFSVGVGLFKFTIKD